PKTQLRPSMQPRPAAPPGSAPSASTTGFIRLMRGIPSGGSLALGLGALLMGGLVWQAVAAAQFVPAYILPAPGAVWDKWLHLLDSGLLWHHAGTTLLEGLAGFALAFVVGVGLGVPLARSRVLAGL